MCDLIGFINQLNNDASPFVPVWYFYFFYNYVCIHLYCGLWCVSSVWSNYSLAGSMWPATAFSMACWRIQEKSSNQKFVEKRVNVHLSHWIACAG